MCLRVTIFMKVNVLYYEKIKCNIFYFGVGTLHNGHGISVLTYFPLKPAILSLDIFFLSFKLTSHAFSAFSPFTFYTCIQIF